MTRAHTPGRRSRTLFFAVLAVTAAMFHPAAAAARPAPGAPPDRPSPQNPAPSAQPQVRTPLGPGATAQPAAQRHGVVPGQVVVTFGAGTSVTGRASSAGRTAARTPATDNPVVNQTLGKVGALSLRPVLGATGAASSARGTVAPAADSALSRTYVVQTSDRDSAAVAKRLRTTPGIAAAEPDRFVNTLAVPGQELPAAALKAARGAAGVQAARRSTTTPPDDSSGSAIPANYAHADSAQALLNAGGVDAAGSFALLKGAYGQDPGTGEIIANVSLGDLVDASMVDQSNPAAVDSGATTILRDGQRYLDLPSMPLIPTYVSDGQGGLSGSASVQGEDPALDEVLLDFSVMSPVQLALDLLAWMPMLALDGPARRWEPKRLRLRLFSAAAHLVTTGRRRWLRLARHWPWTETITTAFERLQALPNPG